MGRFADRAVIVTGAGAPDGIGVTTVESFPYFGMHTHRFFWNVG